MENKFKNKHSYEKRFHESKNIKDKYPDRIPVIVGKCYKSKIPDIDKCKYLIPKDMTIGNFIFVIRKRINIEPSQALFIMINGISIALIKLLSG